MEVNRTNNKKQDYNAWGWIFLFALILLSIYVIDWSFLKGEIREYPIAPCPECSGRVMTLNERVYKPSSTRQDVVSWMPGLGIVDRYTNCAVVNRKNWQCTYNDGSRTFGFSEGKYWNDDSQSKKLGWQYISRFRYLKVKWLNNL
jgi:hypothetical protein